MECMGRQSCWKIAMPDTFTTFDPQEWRLDAACRDLDTAVFFPETAEQVAAAKAVCATCPVREACLNFALITRHDGVWGGRDENERRRARRRRQEAARKAA
jgi:WhiB family redox-sensing transcriptional regulator